MAFPFGGAAKQDSGYAMTSLRLQAQRSTFESWRSSRLLEVHLVTDMRCFEA
jgi:hypothetical protein